MQFRLVGVSVSLALLVSASACAAANLETEFSTRMIPRGGGAEVASENAKEYFNDKAKEDNEQNTDESSNGDQDTPINANSTTPAYTLTGTGSTATATATTIHLTSPLQAIKDAITDREDVTTDSASPTSISGLGGALSAVTAASFFVFVV